MEERNHDARALQVLGATALMGFGIGAVEIGLPALAVHAGSHAAGDFLLALLSIGSMIGGLAYGSRTWRSRRSSALSGALVSGCDHHRAANPPRTHWQPAFR